MAIIYGIWPGELLASERDQRKALILNTFSLQTADAMPFAVLMQKWLLRHD